MFGRSWKVEGKKVGAPRWVPQPIGGVGVRLGVRDKRLD